ncbi:MAG TPA: substrate-binding domain-containing protein, partial [Burkholderiales bacterium]|nr:substrate-binding domain-containing protein [Burkholderiales bacterium]
MRALQDRGLRIPQDVAIAGFDDIPTARFANPSLTTVHQDTKVAATLLVDGLLAIIHGEPAESHSIVPTLVVRESTAG